MSRNFHSFISIGTILLAVGLANATTCVRRDLITGTLDLFRCPGDNDLDDNVYANRTANSSKTFCCGSDSTRYCCDSLEYQMTENQGPFFMFLFISILVMFMALIWAFHRLIFHPVLQNISTNIIKETFKPKDMKHPPKYADIYSV